jgi:manganese transport protein
VESTEAGQRGTAIADQLTAAAIETVPWPAERRRAFALGPGLVHLLGSINPNDLVFNSLIGATYGYSLLWVLVIAYGLNFFVAEAAARYVLVTGESIVEGFGRIGRPIVLALAAAVFIRRHLNNMFLALLLGTAAHVLLPLPLPGSALVWTVISCGTAYFLMFRRGYAGVEYFSKRALVVFSLSLLVLVGLSRPAATGMLRGLFVPSLTASGSLRGSFVLLMALAGTTIGTINHLKYPTLVYEKGWRRVEELSNQRADLAVSIFGQFLLSLLIQVAAAAAFSSRQVQITSVDDLSALFAAKLGEIGRVVVGVGVWASAFNSYVGSNTGYGLLVADVYERFVRRASQPIASASRETRRHHAFRIVLTVFCVPSMYVMFTSWTPFQVGLFQSALFLVITPLLMFGLLRLTNDRAMMGVHVNRLRSRVAIGVAIAVSLYLTYQGAFDVIDRLRQG